MSVSKSFVSLEKPNPVLQLTAPGFDCRVDHARRF